MNREIKEIRLNDTVPFKRHSCQTYEGERLKQLMNSIESIGLLNPIIVQPADNGKYEIICGHNRAKAATALGHTTIKAEVIYGLSDDKALELFYDSNLTQQSFSDWCYSQKIEAIKYTERLIKENSIQGKRNDLQKKKDSNTEDGTYVQSRQKLNKNQKKVTTRDKMARRLGISTATLSKYRRIIKLPNHLLQSIARLLDEKRITFEAAYILSNMRELDIKYLIRGIEKDPNVIIDLDALKKLPNKNTEESDVICPISKKGILEVLTPRPSSDIIIPVRKTK